MEEAFLPGRFVPEGGTCSLVGGLEEVKSAMDALVRSGRAKRAVRLYETLVAGCDAKAEEIDDSGGTFGSFVDEVVCGWVRARRAAGADRRETVERLLAWKDADRWGFFHGIERDLAETFNRGELAAFTEAVRARFDAALRGSAHAEAARHGAGQDACGSTRAAAALGPEPAKPGGRRRPHPYYDAAWPLRQAADMLKTLYEAAGDVEAYAELCETMGLSPRDCERIAKVLIGRKRPAEALGWVERGLGIKKDDWPNLGGRDLAGLRRDILKRLGRREEALRHAWDEFKRHADEYSYGDLMGCVPRAERSRWHERAMDAAEGSGLEAFIGLCRKAREWERLARRVQRARDAEFQGVYHGRAAEAAKALAKKHPAEAAALYRGAGLYVLGRRKRTGAHNEAALGYFAAARRCFKAAGLGEEWERLAQRVRREHHRKLSFMPRFERLARGEERRREPTFLERAKRRWEGRTPSG